MTGTTLVFSNSGFEDGNTSGWDNYYGSVQAVQSASGSGTISPTQGSYMGSLTLAVDEQDPALHQGAILTNFNPRPEGYRYLAVDICLKAPTLSSQEHDVYWEFLVAAVGNNDAFALAPIHHPDQLDPGQPLTTNPTPNLGIPDYTGWRTFAFDMGLLTDTEFAFALFASADIDAVQPANVNSQINIGDQLPDYLILLDNLRYIGSTGDLPQGVIVISPFY